MSNSDWHWVEVAQCHYCKEKGDITYHGNRDNRCPKCRAGAYWQCSIDIPDEMLDTPPFSDRIDDYDIPSNHPIAIEMFRQACMRGFYNAIAGAPMSLINEMLEILKNVDPKKHAEWKVGSDYIPVSPLTESEEKDLY